MSLEGGMFAAFSPRHKEFQEINLRLITKEDVMNSKDNTKL
jgi:hypothetical protein